MEMQLKLAGAKMCLLSQLSWHVTLFPVTFSAIKRCHIVLRGCAYVVMQHENAALIHSAPTYDMLTFVMTDNNSVEVHLVCLVHLKTEVPCLCTNTT